MCCFMGKTSFIHTDERRHAKVSFKTENHEKARPDRIGTGVYIIYSFAIAASRRFMVSSLPSR